MFSACRLIRKVKTILVSRMQAHRTTDRKRFNEMNHTCGKCSAVLWLYHVHIHLFQPPTQLQVELSLCPVALVCHGDNLFTEKQQRQSATINTVLRKYMIVLFCNLSVGEETHKHLPKQLYSVFFHGNNLLASTAQCYRIHVCSRIR